MRATALFAAALLSVAALPACGKAADPEAVKEQPESKSTAVASKKFGAAITEQTSTPLTALVKEPGKFSAQTVRTEGKVSAVCQEMGCWMEISDPAGQAHIKMAGHSFFIPKDASGHRAVVQGKVLNPQADKGHCEAEAEAQTGKVAKVEIEATGVELLD